MRVRAPPLPPPYPAAFQGFMRKPKTDLPKTGPVFTASDGPVKIPVYRHPTRTSMMWMVRYRLNGKPMRKANADFEKAKNLAQSIASEIAKNGVGAVLTLTGLEKERYLSACSKSDECGVSLDRAVEGYSEASKSLGGVPIMEAVRFYLASKGAKLEPISVQDAVRKMIDAKTAAGRSDRHLKDLDSRLGRFASSFAMNLGDVRAEHVGRWLGGLEGVGPRSRNNYLTAIRGLVGYAERREWIHAGQINLDSIDRATEPNHEVTILSPQEMERILEACRPEMMPFVAIAAFAGVRHAEIKRMSWDQIHWEDNTIEVKADQSKNASKMRGRARRMIELQPNLREILLPYKSAGRICDIVKTDNELAKLSRGSGVKWSNNVLRHSFGTYRLAQTRNESVVALEMGNSPAMIHAHYKRPVTQEMSQKWFRIGLRKHR